MVLATRIFSPESAAASFRLAAVVEALVRSGQRVEVLTTTPPRGSRSAGTPHPVIGVTTADPDAAGRTRVRPERRLRVRRWPVLRDRAGYVRGYLPYLSFDMPLALRLAVAERPDVVLVEPPPTTGAVVRAVTAVRGAIPGQPRIPYVYYAADVWSDATASTGAPPWVVRVLGGVEQFALRGAAGVIAVSDGVGARVRELGARTVEVIPNGIDTAVFTPDGPRAAEAPDAPFVLYAGTASEWQGAEVFAEALPLVRREIPDARLVYLGQGSSWARIAELARELPAGAIEQRPLVPVQEAAAWHRSASAAAVSVRPGIGYDFAYPTKVLAALACGTPVVFAGPAGSATAADLAEHRLGAAVEYSVASVAQAMIAVLRDDASQQQPGRGDAGRHRAQWVRTHRSLARTGDLAAQYIARIARPVHDPA